MSRTIRKARSRARHKKTLCAAKHCGWCYSNRKGKGEAIRGTISDEFLHRRRRHGGEDAD